MVSCTPQWIQELEVGILKRMNNGLRQMDEEDLALRLLEIRGTSVMGERSILHMRPSDHDLAHIVSSAMVSSKGFFDLMRLGFGWPGETRLLWARLAGLCGGWQNESKGVRQKTICQPKHPGPRQSLDLGTISSPHSALSGSAHIRDSKSPPLSCYLPIFEPATVPTTATSFIVAGDPTPHRSHRRPFVISLSTNLGFTCAASSLRRPPRLSPSPVSPSPLATSSPATVRSSFPLFFFRGDDHPLSQHCHALGDVLPATDGGPRKLGGRMGLEEPKAGWESWRGKDCLTVSG
ncbi:hypothetical protein V8G54_006441 [Vigna mungo]|uniref:Uncharacterized protein n=1 Tax=Vigna mungo TaxID=3915 RepID=A0AAQ3S4J7_VIGMU